jgi:hypothetical protein
MDNNKNDSNRFIVSLTRFYAPLFDDRRKVFHFFYGFPKDNRAFDFVIGFAYSGILLGLGFLPTLPNDAIGLAVRGALAAYCVTFLLADIFGRKRKFTAIGAVLAGLLLLKEMAVPALSSVFSH